MALLNTVANSTAIVPTTKAASASGIVAGSFGLPSQSADDASTSTTPNPAIHGLRPPAASAIAPSTGDENAMTRPAAAVA